jgi:hypothetical protein
MTPGASDAEDISGKTAIKYSARARLSLRKVSRHRERTGWTVQERRDPGAGNGGRPDLTCLMPSDLDTVSTFIYGDGHGDTTHEGRKIGQPCRQYLT